MRASNFAHDRKSKASSLGACRHEWLEEPRAYVVGNASSGVAHAQAQPAV